MRRLGALGLIAGTLFGCSAPQPPNVILILVDALRADRLGVYGYDKGTTPNLDRLAAEGAVFDRAWAQGSATFVSTSTMMTSQLFPSISRNADSTKTNYLNVLEEDNLLLAEVMSERGYRTFAALTNPHHYPGSGFEAGFDSSRFLEAKRYYTRGEEVNRAFFHWLDEERGDKSPFFAYLHYMDVHTPYDPPQGFRPFLPENTKPWKYRKGFIPQQERPDAGQEEYLNGLYDGEIAYVDSLLGELVRSLEERELEAVIVFTADHGDEFFDHGGLGHGHTVLPELTRVPLFLVGVPGVTAERIDHNVALLDLAPTIVDIAGAPPIEGFQGHSLLPLLRDPESPPRPWVSVSRAGRTHRAISAGRWYATWKVGAPSVALYDHLRDLAAEHDLRAENPDAASRLLEDLVRLEELATEARNSQSIHSGSHDIDSKYIEQLKALGYLDDGQ